MSPLFGKRPPAGRPDLAAWLEGAAPVLVVDGSDGATDAESFADSTVVVHAVDGAPGLPYSEKDPRRLAAAAGDFGAVVLTDVLDEVLDVGPAVAEARRVLAVRGVLLILQTVAPEDHEQRALWNALARLRDPRHTWTPSGKQLSVLAQSFGLSTAKDAVWDEPVASTADGRHALLLASATGRAPFVKDGGLVATRRALLLRRT